VASAIFRGWTLGIVFTAASLHGAGNGSRSHAAETERDMKAAAGTGEAALWDAGRSYQRVILRDMVVEVRLGLHPWERHPERPQRVVVNVELFARQDGPFAGSGVAAVLDYDRIRDAVRAWPLRGHTDLIETLLEELVALCFADGRVEACRVSILKPDIFNETGGAGVEIYRVRGEGA